MRIQDFACDTDFRQLSEKDSWTSFGKRGSPFGGITDVHIKELPTNNEIRWTVAMGTDVVLTKNTLERRLKAGSYQLPKVAALKTKVGKDRQLWRITLYSEENFKRIVCEGVELGYRLEKALPWAAWRKASTRCFKCHKRALHGMSECTARHPTCPKCSKITN